jgi:ATP-binding cassette subfamily C protein LapB
LWENLVGELAISGQRGRLLTSAVNNVCGLLQQLATVLMVFAGVYLIGAGDLSMGGLIAAVMLSSRVLAPMSQIVNLQASYFQTRTAVEGLNQTMQLPVERPPSRNFLLKDAIAGEIEFREVSFSYGPMAPVVLNKISFRIKAGEKVAVIGRIGSGKSTLQKLVMGLYQPTSGMVLIDGVDLRQLDPAFVRKAMAHVSQDFALFEGSIRHNITIGETARNDERLAQVAALTGVNELVRESSVGLDMPVGERGDRLSGGQRQSIMLARALYRQASVYLMDEPTGQLDSASEDHLKRQLLAWMGPATLILTTHKASMLELADRVIVLDRGRLVADGPRQQVLDALQKGEVRVNVPPR